MIREKVCAHKSRININDKIVQNINLKRAAAETGDCAAADSVGSDADNRCTDNEDNNIIRKSVKRAEVRIVTQL